MVPSTGRLYVDAAIVIYATARFSPYLRRARAALRPDPDGRRTLHSSELIITETLVTAYRDRDERLEADTLQAIAGLKLEPVSKEVLELATHFRADLRLKTPDAIHAATAQLLGCSTFLTNDRRLRLPAGIEAVLMDDLPEPA